jgi:ribonuclease HI
MELSAVIAGLNYLPPGMVVWLSTDSQYVQKGMCEWMPKWKRNGWRNSKKAGIANKSLWPALEAAVARHRRIELTWVKAHSGILHNEVADTLATRGVKGTTYCPINLFDQLPPDTEEEDDSSIPPTEVITQTDEFGADDEHLPSYGTQAIVHEFNKEEAEEWAEERERGIRHFLYEQCENSSTPVTDDEDHSHAKDTVVTTSGWKAIAEGPEQQESPQRTCFSIQVGEAGNIDIPESMTHSPWSSDLKLSKEDSEQRRALEDRFGWMTDADLPTLTMGLEPYPWEQFAEVIRGHRSGSSRRLSNAHARKMFINWGSRLSRTRWSGRYSLCVPTQWLQY